MAEVMRYTYERRSGENDEVPVASATVIAVGDYIYLSGGNAMVMTANTQDLHGIAETLSASGDTDPIGVALADGNRVFRTFLAASSNLQIGQPVKWSATNALAPCTAYEFAIGEVAQQMATAGTIVDVRFYATGITFGA